MTEAARARKARPGTFGPGEVPAAVLGSFWVPKAQERGLRGGSVSRRKAW